MIVGELNRFFDERFNEIQEYLSLLHEIETAAQSGTPRILGVDTGITTSQQKILYSSVYLQLYNLVEATVSRCIEAISVAASENDLWRPSDLSDEMRREWIRFTARTHITLDPEKRLKTAVGMFEHLIDGWPMQSFKIEVGGGGNWDDEAIENVGGRLGCEIHVSRHALTIAKRPVRDEMGPLKLVKNLRNGLAHGSISFTECAAGVSASELQVLADHIGVYLREIVACFGSYIDTFGFLQPDRKPAESTS